MTSKALAAGTLLNHRYKIQKILLEKNDRNRYLVLDTKVTDRLWVAEEFFSETSDFEKLKSEAEAAKTLRHPHLLQILDSFIEGNRLYVILEYIEGMSLHAVTELTSENLPEPQALEWALQAIDALIYLNSLSPPYHLKGLNPLTLILDRDGKIKLGGYSFGDTPAGFEPPEYASEKVGSTAGDVYGLAATIYFLLTRRGPEFPLPPFQILLSETVRAFLTASLHPDPQKRPANLTEIRNRFFLILHPPARVIAKPSAIGTFKRSLSAFFKTAYAGALAVWRRPYALVLLSAFAAALFFRRQGTLRLESFHKTSPILFLAERKGVAVINADTGRRLRYFSSLQADRGMFLPKSGDELWLISAKGIVNGMEPSTGRILRSIDLHQEIGGAVINDMGLLYLALNGQNMIATLAPQNGRIIAAFPVGKEARKIAFSAAQKEVYVSFESKPYVSVLGLPAGALKQQWNFPALLSDFIVAPDGEKLFAVFNNLNEAKIFDLATKKEIDSITLDADGPYHLFSFGNTVGITAQNGNKIFLLDSKTDEPNGTIAVSKPIHAIFINGKRELDVASDDGTVKQIDVDLARVTRTWKTGKGFALVYIP